MVGPFLRKQSCASPSVVPRMCDSKFFIFSAIKLSTKNLLRRIILEINRERERKRERKKRKRKKEREREIEEEFFDKSTHEWRVLLSDLV